MFIKILQYTFVLHQAQRALQIIIANAMFPDTPIISMFPEVAKFISYPYSCLQNADTPTISMFEEMEKVLSYSCNCLQNADTPTISMFV